MNTEQQTKQAATVAEIPPVDDSKQSKRGGRRPGAGRKPNLAKRLLKGFSRDAIAEAVAGVDCGAVITGLLKSKREKIRLETLAFVRDTLIGRPAQNVSLSGGVVHAHTVWRPLADLTDEEVSLLDKLTKKLAAPVSNALPDSPYNQTESKPAIEAEIVDSTTRDGVDVATEAAPEAPPERALRVVTTGETNREPESIFDALNRPQREPRRINDSPTLGNWRR